MQYFAQHLAPGKVHWAIAGRNRQKLESVKAQVGADFDVLVADSRDQTAVDGIVSKTQVLLNTAGPFALYGDVIVDACVRFKTHLNREGLPLQRSKGQGESGQAQGFNTPELAKSLHMWYYSIYESTTDASCKTSTRPRTVYQA